MVEYGGETEPVLTEKLKSDSLRDLGKVSGLAPDCPLGVGVHIDEAGRYHHPSQADDDSIRAVEIRSNLSDGCADQSNVGCERLPPRTVYYHGVREEQVFCGSCKRVKWHCHACDILGVP